MSNHGPLILDIADRIARREAQRLADGRGLAILQMVQRVISAYRAAVHSLVENAEQLKALPDGTVLRVKTQELAEIGTMGDGTRVIWSEGWTDLNVPLVEKYFLPARVLYLPEADDD